MLPCLNFVVNERRQLLVADTFLPSLTQVSIVRGDGDLILGVGGRMSNGKIRRIIKKEIQMNKSNSKMVVDE